MRQWMIDMRKDLGLSREEAAKRCECSPRLLEYLEVEDSVTLPSLARQIGKAYGMHLEQMAEICKPLKPVYRYAGGGIVEREWRPPVRETIAISAKEKKIPEEKPELYLRLDALIKATGKSQAELSRNCGRGNSYLGNIMNGLAAGRQIHRVTVGVLCQVLNCEAEDILGGDFRAKVSGLR